MMKILVVCLCTLLVMSLASTAGAAQKVQHVVCFKFKSSATPEEVKKVEEAFRALKKKIPQIKALEWGTNVSKEGRDKGFTHCFIVTFKNEQDRDIYLDHPEHKAFVSVVGPVLDDAFVIDFLAKG